MNPSFSYPGGIWFPKGCHVNYYTALLNFIFNNDDAIHPFTYEKQGGGNLIRFNNAEYGLNCHHYIIDSCKPRKNTNQY